MTDTAQDPFATPPEATPTEALPAAPPRAAADYASLSLHKVLLVAGLAIATILPNMFISNLIEEREQRETGVRADFTRNWGPEQNLYTPVLVIPYQVNERPRQYIKIASTQLNLAANLAPQERKRGLFHATVYDAKLDMSGSFAVPSEAHLRSFLTAQDGRFMWNESEIMFGTASRLAGLRSTDNIVIDGVEASWRPCIESIRQEQVCSGAAMVLAHVPTVIPTLGTRVSFKSVLTLRGTSSLGVQHAGKDLAATFRSSWPSPSFNGNTLPVDSTVTPEGFEAKWEATEFGSPRISVSSVLVDQPMWRSTTIGVDLIEATPIYRMINRVAKYGLLFIVLSFATYFFFEVLSRLRIHVLQYGMLGLSLSLFSLLLLSLAEPIGYTNGYLVAAGLVLLQSTLYTAAVARRFVPTFLFALMLASLFAFIYVLLGLETYSLLIGALALFAVVSALMVLTQMLNLPGRLTSAPA
ncbi:MAG: cell envelope integrity protein CreD [Alphaproteobacteria bacterium]